MVFGASYYTVFDDEAFSCRLYTMPLTEMLGELRHGSDPDPPIYYIVENVWVHLAGISPLALRIPSIVFFLIGSIITASAASTWFGDNAYRPALAITLLHPAHLFFGFAARWYALAFCLVAAISLITARVYANRRFTFSSACLWGFIAGLAMLSNYFLIVIVALHAIAIIFVLGKGRHSGHSPTRKEAGLANTPSGEYRSRPFLAAGLAFVISIIIFLSWLPPFLSTLQTFRDSSPSGSMLSTAVRTLMALLTSNLASPRAWWTWAAATIFGIAFVFRLISLIPERRAVVFNAIGALLIGVVTRTMMDKYIMTFSGLFCIVVAGMCVRRRRTACDNRKTEMDAAQENVSAIADESNDSIQTLNPESPFQRRARTALIASLMLIWITCGIHIFLSRYWASLRWLDEFPAAISNRDDMADTTCAPLLVASHPSARYYHALSKTSDAEDWRAEWTAQESLKSDGLVIPVAMNKHPVNKWPKCIKTIETSGFAELEDWRRFKETLAVHYEVIETREYLRDEDAALKDRLDPNIKHAEWRITTRFWRQKTE